MAILKRSAFRLAVVVAFWYFARWLLFTSFPVYVDGAGPIPSFYWGHRPPAPTLAEWNTNFHAQARVLCSYWIAASVITLLGCVAAWLVRHWLTRPLQLFVATSTATLISLLLVEALSAVGNAAHIWRGPTMYSDIHMAFIFLKLLIPVSLFAGTLALARSHFNW
jgi:hypothetical protein